LRFVPENHAALLEQCNLVGNRVGWFVHSYKKMSRARSYGMATTSVGAKVQTFFISAKKTNNLIWI
jgi:hypothetical protein